jgi:hypothetical protein
MWTLRGGGVADEGRGRCEPAPVLPRAPRVMRRRLSCGELSLGVTALIEGVACRSTKSPHQDMLMQLL